MPDVSEKFTDAETNADSAGAPPRRKTPVWFWIIAVVATLWNFMGVFDYVMTQLGAEWYLAEFTPEQRAFFEGFPAWYVAIWALAVWLAFLASLGLLVRTRFAAPMFAASLGLFLISAVYLYGFTPAYEMMSGLGGVIFSLLIFASLVALWRLSVWAKAAGILR